MAINLLFAFRYLDRLAMNTPLLVAAYLAVYAAALAAVWRMPDTLLDRRLGFVLALGAVSVGSIVVFQMIDFHALRVDRWYMIDTFWGNVAEGRYPYTPRPDSNTPGPLPFYYVMALPFQIMGDIGYFALAGLLAYAYLAWRCIGPGRPAYVALVALFLSISFVWEMATRSTIVVNMVAVIGFLCWLEAYAPRTTIAHALAGVVAGLLLSTRTVVALPLIVYVVHAYARRRRFSEVVVFGAAACVIFMVTLLPIYFWDPVEFRRYNPLLVQADFSNRLADATVLVAAALLGWVSASFRHVIASAGLVLFATVLVWFFVGTMRLGFWPLVHGDYFDPSYFNLSLPFFTFALGQFNMADARG